jgi:AraC-like DNA-binding protein
VLFDFNRYSALLLIFFVHGIVYAAMLARRGLREHWRSDCWLAAFLFLCSLYITPWMVGFAGWYDTQPYRDILFYIPFQHLFAIGPLVYFYVQSLLNPSFKFTRKEARHLIPAALYVVFSVVVVVTDRLVLHRAWFLQSGRDPDFDSWYQGFGFASMLWYAILSLRYYQLFRRLMLQVTSFADRFPFHWVRHFLQAFLAMLALRLLFFVLALFIETDYAGTWWHFFGFALLFYFIAIKGHANTVHPAIAYRPLLPAQKVMLLLPAPGPEENYLAEEEPIDMNVAADETDQLVAEWTPRVEALVAGGQLYRDPDLSLTTLARRLGLPAAYLSRVVNKGFGCNLNDFINGYRVRAVQSDLAAGAHHSQTLVSVAYDCGFNSKATFNRAFQRHAGLSPSEFVRQLG